MLQAASAPRVLKATLAAIDSVLLYAQPVASLEGRLVEDAIALKLFAAGIDVVGREKAARVEDSEFKKASEREKEKDEKSPNKENSARKDPLTIDTLQVAKLCGARGVVSISIGTDRGQKNIYEKDGTKVREVQTPPVVHAASLTLSDVDTGKLLVVVFANYTEPVSLAKAANDLAKSLLEKMQ